MKITLLFLVLVNVLFMTWSRWVAPQPRDAQVVTPEPRAQRLVLFEEKFPERARALREQAAGLPVTREASAPVADDARAVDASALVVIPQSSADAAADPAPALIDSPGDAAPPEALPTDTDAAKSMIDEAVASAIAAPAQADPLVAMTDDGPAAARCVKLGPFLRLREATDAATRLRSVNLLPTQRLEEAQVWVGHWVYLPAHASRAEAIATVEKLRADGVSDIYIEPSGERRNAISLGLFSDAEGAEIRAGKIRKLGVTPEIRDRYRDGSVYWVDFALAPGQNLDPTQFGAAPKRRIGLVEQPCAGAPAGS